MVTIFEIAGYPHLENVSSNILSFYFASSQVHNFGSTLFKSLIFLLGESTEQDVDVLTRREEVTLGSKRIDLILETDALVIGIENKIYHELLNDLDIYWAHLQSISQGRRTLGVLLCLQPVTTQNPHFTIITYQQLFRQVATERTKLGSSLTSKYALFYDDFVRSINNLNRLTTMDTQRLTFLREHQSEVSTLLDEITNFREDIRSKLKSLQHLIAIENPQSQMLTAGGLWRPEVYPVDFLSYTLPITNTATLQADIALSLTGWRIQFFNRRGARTVVQEWLRTRNLTCRIQMQPWRLLLEEPNPPQYEAEISVVFNWIMPILQKMQP